MKSYEKLLLENKAWAAEKVEDDPGFFNRLSTQQTPEFLWIGCSDSRVEQLIMAIYSKASNEWTRISARQEAADRMAAIASEHSNDWQGLGVAVLHRLVFEDLLGLKEMPKPTYVHLVQEVIDGLNGKLEGKLDYPLAAMVMPATIEHIRAVSLHQERMPAKSTYFYPKLVSGLVVHPLA